MRSFAAACELPAERIDAARAALARLPGGAASPFARLGGTHFARLVVLDVLPVPAVLLAAEIDGDARRWVGRLSERAGRELDCVFEHCDAYPGSADAGPLWRYFAARRCRAGFSILSYGDASVPEIEAALALRSRLREFAERAAALDQAALREQWRTASASGS